MARSSAVVGRWLGRLADVMLGKRCECGTRLGHRYHDLFHLWWRYDNERKRKQELDDAAEKEFFR